MSVCEHRKIIGYSCRIKLADDKLVKIDRIKLKFDVKTTKNKKKHKLEAINRQQFDFGEREKPNFDTKSKCATVVGL